MIRILLVDDHSVLRDALRELLNFNEHIQVIGETGDGLNAVQLAKQLRPDVVLMDITLPYLNGVEATRQIVRHVEGVRVLALTMHSGSTYVKSMLEAGATGFFQKDQGIEALVEAIKTVARGGRYLPFDAPDAAPDATPSPVAVLTPRERQVLRLLAQGKASKAIAAELNVTVNTIDSHRKHIMDKLGLHSVAELVKFAIREGMATLHS